MEMIEKKNKELENREKELATKEKHPGKVTDLKKMLAQWQGTLPANPSGNVFSNLRNKKKTK